MRVEHRERNSRKRFPERPLSGPCCLLAIVLLSRAINILSDLPVARCDLTYKSGAATRIKSKASASGKQSQASKRCSPPSEQKARAFRCPLFHRTCRDWGWNLATDRLSFVTAVLLAVFDISPVRHFQEESETIRGMKREQETRYYTKSLYFRVSGAFSFSPPSRIENEIDTISMCIRFPPAISGPSGDRIAQTSHPWLRSLSSLSFCFPLFCLFFLLLPVCSQYSVQFSLTHNSENHLHFSYFSYLYIFSPNFSYST